MKVFASFESEIPGSSGKLSPDSAEGSIGKPGNAGNSSLGAVPVEPGSSR